MKVIDNLSGIESYYLLISGNGPFPERIIFKRLYKKLIDKILILEKLIL